MLNDKVWPAMAKTFKETIGPLAERMVAALEAGQAAVPIDQMTKTTSAALAALLATRQFWCAKLFTFTLTNGTVLRYCSGDVDITYSGNVFSAGGQTGPYFERGDNKAKAHYAIGTQVDTLTFDVIPGSGTVGNFSFNLACIFGLFDGASLLYQKAYMPTYGDTSVGVYDMFKGRVGDITLGRSMVTFVINSYLELLDQTLPRNLYQSGCNNTLYDTSCGVNPALFNAPGTVQGGSTAGTIMTVLSGATGFYDLGKLVMTSGQLNGFAVGIKSWTNGLPGTLLLNKPFPQAPTVGDTFTAYAGCDKKQQTCAGKFSNFANFRGTPYVPVPESAG